METNSEGAVAGGGDIQGGAASAADLLGGVAAGGGGDGGSLAAAETGDGGVDVAGGADPDWYSALSADAPEGMDGSNRDYVKAKGFKDLDGLAKAYRAAEKALHDKGMVKLPGEGASEVEVAAFRKAIGVPDDAKDYAFSAPKDAAGNDIPLDSKLLERISAAGVAHGIPKSALEGLVADFVKGQLDDIADQDAQQGREVDAKLKSWGADRAAKEAAMDNALKVLNLGRDEALAIRGALGVDKSLDLFVRLGEGLAEDKLITGESKRFGVSGAEAEKELAVLKQDREWVRRARTKGTAENARYERLVDAIGAAAEREVLSDA